MEANGIVLSPDPRLHEECKPIEEIDKLIEKLAEKMKKMMFDNGGCGLAAPQIGELIQLVTIDCDYSVVVEAYDLDANLVRYEAKGDLFCVCLQHEIDHLHGKTMFERLKPMARIKALKDYQDALARGAKPGDTE